MAKATFGSPIVGQPIKNNGGTVIYGIAGSVLTQAFGRTKIAVGNKPTPGPIPPLHEAALNFTGSPIAAGPFAQMRTNKYMIIKVTKEIATVPNTTLYMTPNNSWSKSINYKESSVVNVTKGAVINYFTGQYTTTLGVTRDNFGNDVSAHPTRLVPGKIVIFYGNVSNVGGQKTKNPVIKQYPARTVA